MTQPQDLPDGVDPVWLAQSRLKRRKWGECADLCTDLLTKNPYDQVVSQHCHLGLTSLGDTFLT